MGSSSFHRTPCARAPVAYRYACTHASCSLLAGSPTCAMPRRAGAGFRRSVTPSSKLGTKMPSTTGRMSFVKDIIWSAVWDHGSVFTIRESDSFSYADSSPYIYAGSTRYKKPSSRRRRPSRSSWWRRWEHDSTARTESNSTTVPRLARVCGRADKGLCACRGHALWLLPCVARTSLASPRSL